VSEPKIIRFGPIRCLHIYNARVMLDFCQRLCGLMGAAVCPRSPSFEEVVKVEMEDEKNGARVAT